ncbi:MAG: diguanylate cyclase domain-containing protein [Acidimicrobiia bacterium]
MEHATTVLVVGDSSSEADYVAALLTGAAGESFVAEVAGTLGAALDRLEGGGVDAVVLDLSLPDSHGEDTFVSMLSEFPELPVLVMTGEQATALGLAAVNRGAQDYLVRSALDADGLGRAVRSAIERQRAFERMKARALFDPLTGLPNRALFNDRLAHALVTRRGTVAVLFVDLDRFKQVNDRFGHAAGDNVLVHVADRFRQCVRVGDTLARIGGDEFVVLIEDAASSDEAVQVATRLVAALEHPLAADGHDLSVGASIGVAMAGKASTAEDLMGAADQAMYRAKAAGGGVGLSLAPPGEPVEAQR